MNRPAFLRELVSDPAGQEATLDRVFFALSDPLRRALLDRLAQGPATVGELAAPHPVSLQAVSRHIQVLVQAGLIAQERDGRIAHCSLTAEPVQVAALWMNRYAKYWQHQFEALVAALPDPVPPKKRKRK
jgi:DNA-binding transcriptional ArsR family regulator